VRLVTVTGAGGIGKTRFAQQVAAEVLESFMDGVWFVRLSRLVDPELVLPTIAQTLALKEVLGQPIAQTLAEHLREKQLLLLLDNFEQVVAAAPEIGELLAHSPGLKVLVTSRVPLRLRGEHDYALTPLPLPESGVLSSPERLTQYAAVALFVERASAAQADFAVTTSNAPAIAEICVRLDGLPLAIELAATRVTLLSPEALLSRLSSQLQLLTGGARDLEARQQTMRATIAWSVALLRPAEQELFRRLSVFVGGGTLEAIETVCVTQGGTVSQKLLEGAGPNLLDTLGVLVDQSLVQRRQEGGEIRFGMRHVIQEYALEQLAESGEKRALQLAHAAYYVELVEQLEPQLAGPSQIELFARLEREHDNLRSVLACALEQGEARTGARLCVALHPFLNMGGHWIEEEQWVTQVVSLGNELAPQLRARLLGTAGYVARSQGDYAAATQHFEESLALCQSMGDTGGVGAVLGQLAVLAFRQEYFERAEQLFEESLTLLREIGDPVDMLYVLRTQAELPLARGHLTTARRIIEEALSLAASMGETHDIAECKARLGWLALLEGHDASAQALVEEALQVQRQLNDTNCSAHSLGYLGLLALERGEVATAQSRLAESLARYTDVANLQGIAETQIRLGMAHFVSSTIQQARDAYLAGLRIAQRLGNKQCIAAGLERLAEIALAQGDPERAARLLGAASHTLTMVGAAPLPLPPRLRAEREQIAARTRQTLGEAAWEEAFAAGEALSLDETLAEVLAPAYR
jgi:predicted ATPase